MCPRVDTLRQGHLVFQFNPNEGQSLYRLGSQPTASSRNVRMACPPKQANGSMASRGHALGNVATAHLRAVLIEGDIAAPVRLVLNLPLPAHQAEQDRVQAEQARLQAEERASQEAALRQAAEARVAELEAQLRAFQARRSPETP